MKLSVTEYEREQLAMARQIIAELNANLAGRGAEFRFSMTLAGKSNPDADVDRHLVVNDGRGSA